MRRLKRDVVAQTFWNFKLTVKVNPTPISQGFQQSDVSQRIDSIIFSNDSTNARSVFLGNLNVTATAGANKSNGLEIRTGKSYVLNINNERVLYEVEAPLIDSPAIGQCRMVPEMIPLVVWDISSLYLVAAADTDIAIMFFRNMQE